MTAIKFYLIGIKGSGMSALALLLQKDGHTVTGSDVGDFIYTETELMKHHIKIHDLDDTSYLDNYFVIVGHKFMDQHLADKFDENRVPFMEYHHFLDSYLDKSDLVSICGSHGKTTLTGLLTSGSNFSSCLRGDGYGLRRQNEKYFFLESCEYQDHFLTYNPSFIVITNIDYDHVDYFKTEEDYMRSFRKFSQKTHRGLVDYESAGKLGNSDYYTYGLNDNADFYVKNYTVDDRGIRAELFYRQQPLIDFALDNLFGVPLLKDAIATFAFYYIHGENLQIVVENVSKFTMARKRFNIINVGKNVIIDDYAHHPRQIAANLDTVKKMYHNCKFIAFFKPDRESRLVYFRQDYIDIFNCFDMTYLVDSQDKKFCDRLLTMENDKIKYLENIRDINGALFKNDRCVYLLMSSKNLNEIKDILQKINK